jgi:LuxR family maltose regulon positive regulatory protein
MRSATPLAPAAVPATVPEAPPAWRPGLVPRSRLVRRLVGCRDTPIVLLVAPAGYGKTTLLSEWSFRDRRPFVWVSPDRLDVVDDAVAHPAPQVLVVDDAHALGPTALKRLAGAAQRLPAGGAVALAARRPLALPTGRLRANRLVLDIRAQDLAMSRLEAALLLDDAGLRLEAPQVDLLVERTEGWPAALYLAALALAEQPGDGGAVDDFTGADRLVADYLREEILAELTEEQRTFLRRSSPLARASGPLCDATLDARGSAETLRALAAAGLPMERLDRTDTAFRYHPLLAAMLRAELACVEPELGPALHRRAADWYEREGDAEQALQHAVAGRDPESAARLLWALAPRYLQCGNGAALATWLRAFGDSDLGEHPALALTAAAHHLVEGRRDHAERSADAAARALDAETDRNDMVAAIVLLRACIARDGVARMGEEAARAARLTAADGAAQAPARLLMGIAHHLRGDRQAAHTLLEDAVGRATGSAPVVAALAHAQLALLAAEGDNWDGAAHDADAARATLESIAGGRALDPARAFVLAVSALVAAYRGELPRAQHDAADGQRLLASLAGYPPWLVAQVLVWLARAKIRLSDGPAARMLLARAARAQAQVPEAPVLADWLHDGWERADAFAASATGDGPMLTNAELRVLRLLPSHLSFREIAERLHVSTNTVKTQALSVYRKLNVSSRSGAVARGLAAGLIDR